MNMSRSEIKKLVDHEVGSRPEAFADFLDALAEAADGTADHLRSAWQDNASAKFWDQLRNRIDKIGNFFETQRPF